MAEPGVLAACLLAQDVATVVLKEMGVRRWSVERLRREAGLEREQVEGVTDGTAWVAPYTLARVLTVLGIDLEVVPPERGRRRT